MNLSMLKDKRIAIWGMGREGKTTLAYLRDVFPEKEIIIINNKMVEDADHFVEEEHILDNLNKFDVLIKSPGISYYHDAISEMKKNGVEITSATNIWFSTARKGKVIAITGSNGKSTTSALLHHILERLGHKAELGGNIGTPLLSLNDNADYYVVELSSYQTCDLKYAPDIAVLLNLHPEHIQWHRTHEQYYNDKCNLLRREAPINITNFNETRTKNIATNTILFNDPEHLHFKGPMIMDGATDIGDAGGFPLLGDHNLENLCAALSVCKELGLDLKECFEASFSYHGLPHRLQVFGPVANHMFVNDSISTDPEATIAALNALSDKDITLIIGGEDREQDYDALCALIDKSKNVKPICVYETGPRLFDQINNKNKETAENLEDAVRLAKEITPKGGYIILSPASPSYDAFSDFEERGNLFMQYAKN
mgnify:CR=1 FL=1